MNHAKAFILKFIATFVVLYIILGVVYNMALRDVFFISLVLGVVAYILGDLFILPRTNNTMATISDFVLSLIVIWVLGKALGYDRNLLLISFISSVVVTVFEFFFHIYVAKLFDTGRERRDEINTNQRNLKYQTETSEEIYPVSPNQDNDTDKDR
ncbi:YndM family protein [Bacillus sp. APMAM]|uniref:DUF2512 family protein n=1 Tax=Margalitia sp. FSL K6-0131 TaxID=2954604 RepID=UPI0016002F1E|nr:YndM family protein [Bacillus sp. APMAM]